MFCRTMEHGRDQGEAEQVSHAHLEGTLWWPLLPSLLALTMTLHGV